MFMDEELLFFWYILYPHRLKRGDAIFSDSSVRLTSVRMRRISAHAHRDQKQEGIYTFLPVGNYGLIKYGR